MAVLGVRYVGGGPERALLAFVKLDGEADLPPVARCFPGDTAFAVTGGDAGKSWQVQSTAGGNAWVNVTPGGSSSPTASLLPTPDATLNLGGPSNAWAILYADAGLVCKDQNFVVDLPFAGASQVSFSNSSVGVGRTCSISADGTVQWQNGASGINAFTFDGVPTGSRVITWQDSSGTVAYLEPPQTWAERQTFTVGATIGAGYYLRFAGAFEGRVQAATLAAGRTWVLPDLDGTVVIDAGAQTLSLKTFSRCRATPLTVAAINALSSPQLGEVAYASDGRKDGEGAAAGTGVFAGYSAGGWTRIDGEALVA